jgi:hypothetical protein
MGTRRIGRYTVSMSRKDKVRAQPGKPERKAVQARSTGPLKQRAGRPRISADGEALSAPVKVRLSESQRTEVLRFAEIASLSTGAWIRQIIADRIAAGRDCSDCRYRADAVGPDNDRRAAG